MSNSNESGTPEFFKTKKRCVSEVSDNDSEKENGYPQNKRQKTSSPKESTSKNDSFQQKYEELLCLRLTEPEEMLKRFKENNKKYQRDASDAISKLKDENERLKRIIREGQYKHWNNDEQQDEQNDDQQQRQQQDDYQNQQQQQLNQQDQMNDQESASVQDEIVMELKKSNAELKSKSINAQNNVNEMKSQIEQIKNEKEQLENNLTNSNHRLEQLQKYVEKITTQEIPSSSTNNENNENNENRESNELETNQETAELADLIDFYQSVTGMTVRQTKLNQNDAYICSCINSQDNRELVFSLGPSVASPEEVEYNPIKINAPTPDFLENPIFFDEPSLPQFLSRVIQAVFEEQS